MLGLYFLCSFFVQFPIFFFITPPLIEDWVLWWVLLFVCVFACLSTNISLELHTDTHPFNGPLSGTTRVGRYQKGKTNLDFTEARDSEWQWHQLGYMHICTSLQRDNHANTPPLNFLRAGCPSCCPSVKALELPIWYSPNVLYLYTACYLCLRLGSLLALSMLCSFGFMDDVIFAHKPMLLDVAKAHLTCSFRLSCKWHVGIPVAGNRYTGLLRAVWT